MPAKRAAKRPFADLLGQAIAAVKAPHFLYGRTSTDEQEEAGTIEAQRYELRDRAQRERWPVEGEFWDDGVSGTLPLEDRPAGHRLLERLAVTPGAVVVFRTVTRLGRSLRVLLDAYEQIDGYGCAIKSATEPFDTTTAVGKFIFQMLGMMAEFDRSNLISTMVSGRDRKAREHRWTGGPIPYGYDVEPLPEVTEGGRRRRNTSRPLVASQRPVPQLGPDWTEARVLLDLFRRVGGGSSLLAECDRLNGLGVPAGRRYADQALPKTLRSWTPTSLGYILHNPVYLGAASLDSRNGAIARTFPQLVDRETWDRAQAQLLANRRFSRGEQQRDYLLRGLIRCECGGAYVGGPGGSGHNAPENRYYYRCSGTHAANRPDPATRCRAKMLPALRLEDAIWEECVDHATHPERTLERAQAQRRERLATVADTGAEQAALARSIGEKDGERQRVLDLYQQAPVLMPLDEATRRLRAIAEETAALQAQLATLRDAGDLAESYGRKVERAGQRLLWLAQRVEAIAREPDPVAQARAKREVFVDLLAGVTVRTIEAEGVRRAEVEAVFTFDAVAAVAELSTARRTADSPTTEHPPYAAGGLSLTAAVALPPASRSRAA